VAAKSLGQSEKLNICPPLNIHTPAIKFPWFVLYIAVRDRISPLLDKTFSFGRSLYKSKSIALSKPGEWRRTYHKKT
jgi:hypothetical protein